MTRPSWSRHIWNENERRLYLGRFALSGRVRDWRRDLNIAEAMSGADELEACQPRTFTAKGVQLQNLPRVNLSAHWWHG